LKALSEQSFEADSVHQELERILSNPGFSRADRPRRFLRFIVEQTLEGKADQLKETVIGVAAFARKPDYDPRADSTVRIEAGKLRSRLEEYYRSDGKDDPIVIELPKGSYVPVFRAAVRGVHKVSRWAIGAGAVVAIVAAAGIWESTLSRPALSSIAVLPFLSLSSSPETEFFSDGLTDQLTATVSGIAGLRVTSRTSAFALKGTKSTIHEIGAKLNVAAVLEGSVQEDGGRLRVTAQLIRTGDDNHLWSQTYEREKKDVFALQDDISRSIATALRVKLTATPRPSPSSAKSLEAYNLFLKGRYLCDRFSPQDLRTALSYLRQAVEIDPNNTAAYAWLAQTYLRLWNVGGMRADEGFAGAQTAARRALDIDATQPEALTALGQLSGRAYDWKEAEKLYLRAIAANPNSALAHRSYALLFLSPHGRREEAIQESRRAQELDPLSIEANTSAADVLLFAGRYDEAIEQSKKALELDAQGRARSVLGRAYLQKGMYREALPMFSPSGWPMACGQAMSGNRPEAIRILGELLSQDPPTPPRSLAAVYATLGDKDRAFEWLEKSYRQRDPGLLHLTDTPEYASLRGDPRFKAMLQKINLDH
jgi:TolB-like protein/Tfp pilus assembly protein PilF